MFFYGQLAASGISLPAIRDDIISLVTGGITNINQLSAQWIQANCKLVTTVAPGWSVLDAAAGSTTNGMVPKVISAPYSDDPTKFKCIRMSGDASAAGIALAGYESWNAGTHVGTNIHATPAATQWNNLGVAANQWVLVSASPTHLLLVVMASVPTNANAYYFASEYTRDDPWNTVANGYPAWFTCGGTGATPAASTTTYNLAFGRIFRTDTLVDIVGVLSNTTGAAAGNVCKIIPAYTGFGADAAGVGLDSIGQYHSAGPSNGADSSKAAAYMLSPLRLAPWNTLRGPQLFGSITAKTPFVYAFRSVWNTADEVDIGGVRYFICGFGSVATNMCAIKEQ